MQFTQHFVVIIEAKTQYSILYFIASELSISSAVSVIVAQLHVDVCVCLWLLLLAIRSALVLCTAIPLTSLPVGKQQAQQCQH
jgi:Cu/Ag efflux pump CusA